MALYKQAESSFYWYDFTVEGRRHRGSTKTSKLTAARRVEAEVMQRALQHGSERVRPGAAPTLRQFSERFLQWVETGRLERNTRVYYAYGWRLLATTSLPDYPLNRITSEMIEATTFPNCSPKYANQALCTLRRMFGKAVEWKYLPAPVRVKLEKAPKRTVMYNEASEHQLLSVMSQDASDVFVFIMDSGMRPAEIFPLRIEGQVFWESRQIWIRKSKTPDGERFVPVSDRMMEILVRRCAGRTQGFVFASAKSSTGHLTTVKTAFNNARRKSGIDPRLVLYSARHTFGTFAMRQTKNLFAVMKTMGHATVRSTERYQHHQNDEIAAAINQRNADAATRHSLRHSSNDGAVSGKQGSRTLSFGASDV